ncbi:GMC oxidoreductase-domain-containing protein [Mycena metata]|uniref:GMC oxidoreductase-domain-containing protein n=1 Tax=Mycena metata TaxID=1033252 RepID=A0AAD7N857_9AGAR|nr:GMC oxidoreductase-domain-containing protein [Mycena metata]
MDSPTSNSEYDIIFAGCGTAACVTAGRLPSANSRLRILIVENGACTKDSLLHVQPARWVLNAFTATKSPTFTFHPSNPSVKLNGRAPATSNANCIGGGGSVNGLMYNRAPASDYDDWMRLGNPGWGAADLIPLAKKLETYQAGVVDSTHGSSGPIKVSYGGYETDIAKDFPSTAGGFPRGRNFTEALNDFHRCDLYGRIPKYIDAETGRRSDTAHHYVYNQAYNQNLHILTNARVNRVIFDGEKRAVGIEYQTGGKSSVMQTARASRLVVSAGTYCSPAILERSGIGAKEILEKHGIPVVSDLPGVGENYKAFAAQWLRDGKGLIATNGVEAAIKLRPNAEDLAQFTSSFTSRWETFYANAADKPTTFICTLAGNPLDLGHVYGVAYFATYPRLLCSINLLVLRWSYKWSRELARRMTTYRGEYIAGHPKFPGSQAECREAKGPVEISAAAIQYSAADNEAIDEFHRANAGMGWHALGTCAMRPREESGVVDPRLNVYGVTGLKVVDLSIAPLNVGANTYHLAILIGQKVAMLVAEELGTPKV